MNWIRRLRVLARINAEAPRSDVERTLITQRVETATIKRATAKWREKGNDGNYEHAGEFDQRSNPDRSGR